MPSVLNATDVTGPVGPVRTAICRWLAMSHSRAVPSALPVASVLPSALNATEVTAPPSLVRTAMMPGRASGNTASMA